MTYFYDFFFYFYYCGTVCKSKSLYFLVLKKKLKCIFFKKLNETDASLDFLTVEKVAVSLPTKYVSNPTSGSDLIRDYRLGHAHNPGFAYMNPDLNVTV